MSFFDEAVEEYTSSTALDTGHINSVKNLPKGVLISVPISNWMTPNIKEHKSSVRTYDAWEVFGYAHGVRENGEHEGVVEDRLQLKFSFDNTPAPIFFRFIVTDAYKAKIIDLADNTDDDIYHVLLWRVDGYYKRVDGEMDTFAALRIAAEGTNGKFVDTKNVVGRRR